MQTCAKAVFPQVSVIVAVGDAEETVGRDIRRLVSYLQSRNLAFEIVAVNDGCRDNSLSMLRLLAAEIPELRLCLADASCRAFSRGLSEARGRMVMLCEAGSMEFPLGALGWAFSRIKGGRVAAVVLRGRCVVADRSCHAAIERAHGRDELFERNFERNAAALSVEIFGHRPARRRAGLLAPVLRFLAA